MLDVGLARDVRADRAEHWDPPPPAGPCDGPRRSVEPATPDLKDGSAIDPGGCNYLTSRRDGLEWVGRWMGGRQPIDPACHSDRSRASGVGPCNTLWCSGNETVAPGARPKGPQRGRRGRHAGRRPVPDL